MSPNYIFLASNAVYLGLMLYMQDQFDNLRKNMVEYKNSDEELEFPGSIWPLLVKVLSMVVLLEDTVRPFLNHARRFRETKRIIVNTYLELEQNALKFRRSETDIPKVYRSGPYSTLRALVMMLRSVGTLMRF